MNLLKFLNAEMTCLLLVFLHIIFPEKFMGTGISSHCQIACNCLLGSKPIVSSEWLSFCQSVAVIYKYQIALHSVDDLG